MLTNKQEGAVKFILGNKKAALFLKCGNGKTLIILEMLRRLKYYKVLLIAPLRVIRNTWPDEIKKWKYNEIKYSQCFGNINKRHESLGKFHNMLMLNVENTKWLCDQFSILPYNILIIDESSIFKSHSTVRFKTLKKNLDGFDRIVILSGTPASNSLMDLWAQFYILDKGERLECYITYFRNKYYRIVPWSIYNYVLNEGAKKLIYKAIEDITLMYDYDTNLDVRYLYDISDFDTIIMNKYKYLQKHYVYENINASNAAIAFNKLLQFCQGFIYDKQGDVVSIHKIKIKALTSIIENNQDENFIIAYNFKEDLKRLKYHFPFGETLTDSNVNKWNKGNIKLLFVHPKSCGRGLNLQYGGSCLIWYCLNPSLELYHQLNYRIIRKDQDKTIKIIHIIIKDTLESRIINVLAKRDAIQEDLFRALIKFP